MNLRDYISIHGGLIGLFTFTVSIILAIIISNVVALIVNTMTLLSLNPYVTFKAYWEKENDYMHVQSIWYGKIGMLISLVSLLNLVWFNYLIYSVTNSMLLAIVAFLVMILFLPKLLISLMIRIDEF
jgi:hypothetical protein